MITFIVILVVCFCTVCSSRSFVIADVFDEQHVAVSVDVSAQSNVSVSRQLHVDLPAKFFRHVFEQLVELFVERISLAFDNT